MQGMSGSLSGFWQGFGRRHVVRLAIAGSTVHSPPHPRFRPSAGVLRRTGGASPHQDAAHWTLKINNRRKQSDTAETASLEEWEAQGAEEPDPDNFTDPWDESYNAMDDYWYSYYY